MTTDRSGWGQPTKHENDFVQQGLIRLLGGEKPAAANPQWAALAALRRGLGKSPGEAAEMFPYVIPWCGGEMSEYRQNDYFLVASLFALHQGRAAPHPSISDSRRNSLGGSFQLVAKKTESGSIEKRFVAMLNASREELDSHLRHAIALLKAHEIGVDWAQLLHDLKDWEWSSRPVQRRWASGFWYETATPGDKTTTDASDAPDASSANV